MRVRRLTILMGALAALGALAGCGGSSDQTIPAASPVATTTMSTSTAGTTAVIEPLPADTVLDRDKLAACLKEQRIRLGGGEVDPLWQEAVASAQSEGGYFEVVSPGRMLLLVYNSPETATATIDQLKNSLSGAPPEVVDKVSGTQVFTDGNVVILSFLGDLEAVMVDALNACATASAEAVVLTD